MKISYLPWLVIILFIIIPISIAADWQYNSDSLIINTLVGSKISIIKTSDNYNLKYIKANLSLFPREDHSITIKKTETYPDALIGDSSLIFNWDNPVETDFEYHVKSKIESKNIFKGIDKKIPFPPRDIPEEVEAYTKPTKNIDFKNIAIISLASELADGEDDSYVVVFKLAKWVEESINYSLDTLTADASQKASWVLDNRYGVCDELTSLFIALARSLGFPAKFVSGLAYTNYNNLNDFGPHAWAEIYFPGYGWIPFDITYAEFGWVDPTHIKFQESVDSDESSVNYQWYGSNIDIKKDELEIKAEVEDIKPGSVEPIKINVAPFRKGIGFGSYNLIETEVENLDNTYRPISLFISKTREIKVLDRDKKHILLKPREKKKVYWLIKVDDNLDDNYLFTFPVEISSTRNISGITEFKSSALEKFYSKDEIESILKELSQEDNKVYSRNINLSCESSKPSGYINDITNIECILKNLGNTLLNDINVCIEDKCQKVDLGINQEESIKFNKIFDKPGLNDIKITAKNAYVSKVHFIPLITLDKPSVLLNNVTFPDSVNFDDEFDIILEVERKSISVPRNVIISLSQGYLHQEFELNDLESNQKFVVKYKANTLREGINNFDVSITYDDDRNERYEAQKSFAITLKKITVGQKIVSFLNRLSVYISNIFS